MSSEIIATYNFFKITNISLLFRSFIIKFDIDKASEKKRNICDFEKIVVFFVHIF